MTRMSLLYSHNRYTAYFYGFPDYLVSTTHPKSNILGRMNAKKYLAQIEESCTQFELKGLQVRRSVSTAMAP